MLCLYISLNSCSNLAYFWPDFYDVLIAQYVDVLL